MSQRPIEVQWGGGKWPNAPKRRLRPYVRTALDLAQLGLVECFGISGQAPDTATIWCVEDTETIAGLTDMERPDDIELHIGHSYIKRPRKLPRVVAPLVTAATHEIAHVYRLQSGHEFDLLEHAAAEGVSMYAEQVIATELGLGQITEHDPQIVLALSPDRIVSMLDRLVEDNEVLRGIERINPESEQLVDLHDDWFDLDKADVSLPDGYIVGMHGVHSRLAEGIAFSDIIKMPAHEVLGVG